VIGRLLEVGKDLRLHARVQGSRSDNFLEQSCIHPTGAGAGNQQAARSQQLESQQVDILIAAGRLLGLGGGRGNLGGSSTIRSKERASSRNLRRSWKISPSRTV